MRHAVTMVAVLATMTLAACGSEDGTKTVTVKPAAATTTAPPDLSANADLMQRVEAQTEQEYRQNLKSKVERGTVNSSERTRASLKTFSCTPEGSASFTCNARVTLKVYVDGYCQEKGGYYEITGSLSDPVTLETEWAASDARDDEWEDCL